MVLVSWLEFVGESCRMRGAAPSIRLIFMFDSCDARPHVTSTKATLSRQLLAASTVITLRSSVGNVWRYRDELGPEEPRLRRTGWRSSCDTYDSRLRHMSMVILPIAPIRSAGPSRYRIAFVTSSASKDPSILPENNVVVQWVPNRAH